jgi:predicted metalloprotease with PDZ domain
MLRNGDSQQRTHYRQAVSVIRLFFVVLIVSGCGSAAVSEPGPSSAAPVFGLVLDANKRVLQVEPGSASEKAGVQIGDVIEAINGISLVRNPDEARDAVMEARNVKKAIMVKLKRNDQEQTLQVTPASPVLPQTGPIPPTVTPVLSPNDYW